MVMTVLEARVSEENWTALEQAYADAEATRPRGIGLIQTYLVQNIEDEEVWRLITVWSSFEALQEWRRSSATPTGLQIFSRAHAEPEVSMFEVFQPQ